MDAQRRRAAIWTLSCHGSIARLHESRSTDKLVTVFLQSGSNNPARLKLAVHKSARSFSTRPRVMSVSRGHYFCRPSSYAVYSGGHAALADLLCPARATHGRSRTDRHLPARRAPWRHRCVTRLLRPATRLSAGGCRLARTSPLNTKRVKFASPGDLR